MKSAVWSQADRVCLSWKRSSSAHSPALSRPVCVLRPHPLECFCLSASLYSWVSLCLGLWAGLWQGLLWLSLPRASNGKQRDRLCHIMQTLLARLWLRVVIQNWCQVELELTSCQRRMFSAGRQARSNDNVGYAWRAMTAPFTLWLTWWCLTQWIPLS